MRRLILLAIVALGLAPVTCVHDPGPPGPLDERPILTFAELPVRDRDLGEVRVAGAWRLDSPNHHFGSYSALVSLDDGTLLAASDRGRNLRFSPPGNARLAPQYDYFSLSGSGRKSLYDIEAVTRDARTGQVWAAYERSNTIERYSAALRSEARAQPAAMQGWRGNSGAEAMVRLADGRFIVLAEVNPRWFSDDVPGLLFAGDPVAGAAPISFGFRPPEGFRPVDMALLPNGRVLILVRDVVWPMPPRFAGKLVLADPSAIRAGEAWSGTVIADFDDRVPCDNYEGLAVVPAPGGGLVLWLISDDNSIRLQRTLLLKLLWNPNEKARGASRAPR